MQDQYKRRRHPGALRRESALRSTPLHPCGCIRDPNHDRHRCHGMSDRQVAGAVAAAHHLLELDLTPIFNIEMLRLMWRIDPRVVDELRAA